MSWSGSTSEAAKDHFTGMTFLEFKPDDENWGNTHNGEHAAYELFVALSLLYYFLELFSTFKYFLFNEFQCPVLIDAFASLSKDLLGTFVLGVFQYLEHVGAADAGVFSVSEDSLKWISHSNNSIISLFRKRVKYWVQVWYLKNWRNVVKKWMFERGLKLTSLAASKICSLISYGNALWWLSTWTSSSSTPCSFLRASLFSLISSRTLFASIVRSANF